MWFAGFENFKDVAETFRIIILFNTLKEHRDGLTLYDLKTQYSNIPYSQVYRDMNELEAQGYLAKEKETNPTGRPKYLFSLTSEGETYLLELRTKIREQFKAFQMFLEEKEQEFSFGNYLNKATFKIWKTPLDFILERECTVEAKLRVLEDLRDRHRTHLEILEKTIQELREQNREDEHDK